MYSINTIWGRKDRTYFRQNDQENSTWTVLNDKEWVVPQTCDAIWKVMRPRAWLFEGIARRTVWLNQKANRGEELARQKIVYNLTYQEKEFEFYS